MDQKASTGEPAGKAARFAALQPITRPSFRAADFIAKRYWRGCAGRVTRFGMSEVTTSIESALPRAKPAAPARKRLKAPWQFWLDSSGRVSPLRIVALLFLFVPVAVAVYDYNIEGFGARPLNNVIHRAGFWALIFLMTSLAITPLRRIGRFGQLLDVRRMIGVGAFVYAAAHISLYITDQMFDLWKVASEIVLRLYLTIGFVALLGLAVLAITSTDGMVRRLGGQSWQRLHNVIYGIALLALIHFFQQTKADVSVPTFVAGLFGWMIGYRLLIRFKTTRGELPAWKLLALSVAVAALTFAAEAIGKLNASINEVIKEPEFARRFAAFGYEMVGGTVKEFADFLKDDIERYRKLTQSAGITPE
jgi:sulfoxide reductase heme-binding subunit YedZ